MSDRIEIELPALPCRIGVLPGENLRPQPVAVRVGLEVDLEAAGRSGRLADTIDYAAVHARTRELVLARTWTLVESLAHAVVREALAADARIRAVEVEVEKCTPPLGEGGGPVRIRMRREQGELS